jgi:hypothetical protein
VITGSSSVITSETRLQQDQPDERAGDDADRQQRVAELVDAVHPALEHQCGEQHAGDLGQLGWLNAEAADAEPPAGAVDWRAEQDANEHHADGGEHPPDEVVVLVRAVVDPHGDGEHRQPEHGPHRLAGDEQVRLLEPFERHQRRRAVHHHDAGADQQQRRGEQDAV